MSKSGLYAHFRSKLELQLATISTADEVFRREVIDPGHTASPGTARVLALSDAFLSHVERGAFPGGCFFVAATAEMNVRPGPVRERIAEFVAGWLHAIEDGVREAQSRNQIAAEIDPAQLAFEINALLVAANLALALFSDPQVLDRARIGIRERLHAAATDSGANAIAPDRTAEGEPNPGILRVSKAAVRSETGSAGEARPASGR